MTRVVHHAAHGPQAVPKTASAGDHLYVCRCGLSASPYGLCDGSHKATLDEAPGRAYLYERRDGKLVRVEALPMAVPVAPVPLAQVAGGSA
jgi:CDGSH-type Zn-finger protein